MGPELLSIIVLVALFAAAVTLRVHLGVLGFAAAYVMGLAFDIAPETIFDGFPTKLVILILGVTYLFSIAQANGTINWLISAGIDLVGGHVALIPWVIYITTVIIVGMGALNAAGLACVAPIAMSCAYKYRIRPFLMIAMAGMGANAGGFSPISPLGAIVNTALQDNGITPQPLTLFLLCFAFFTVVTAVVYFLLKGHKADARLGLSMGAGAGASISTHSSSQKNKRMITAGSETKETDASIQTKPDTEQVAAETDSAPRFSFRVGLTLLAIVSLLLSVLVFSADVGLFAFLLAAPLALFATDETPKQTLTRVPWSVVLLIGGILTYVGVAEHLGALDYAGNLIALNVPPILALLLVFYVGAISSTFAAGSAVLVATMPFLVPLLNDNPEVVTIGAVSAMAISSLIVDLSPLSPTGAIMLANYKGDNENSLFKILVGWGALSIVFAPILTWLVFVVLI